MPRLMQYADHKISSGLGYLFRLPLRPMTICCGDKYKKSETYKKKQKALTLNVLLV